MALTKSYTILSIIPEENRIIVLLKVGDYSTQKDFSITNTMTKDQVITMIKKELDTFIGFKQTTLETDLSSLINVEVIV